MALTWPYNVLADNREQIKNLTAEVDALRAQLADRDQVIDAGLPVLQYVSMGRRYVDVEPYPDAAARMVLGMLPLAAGQTKGSEQ